MGDWSGWSSCSKDCGGGVMTRSRVPVTESENGGMTCGEATDPQQCNVEQSKTYDRVWVVHVCISKF